MQGERIAFTPDGTHTVFKRDTVLCNLMLYIIMHESQAAVAMVQTVGINFEGYNKKQVDKDVLDLKVQTMVGHPNEERFKHMVGSKILNDLPMKVEYVTT